MIARRARRHVGALVGLALGVLILGPGLWGTGFWLRYDMVFAPHLALGPATLGVDGSVPRAVPNDIVVAVLSTALPGWLVQRLILLGAFVCLGAAADALRWRASATIVTTAGLSWNPWMFERLGIGHWGYLWGAAGVVWVMVGVVRQLTGQAGRRPLMIGLLVASLSGSTGAVMALLTFIVALPWLVRFVDWRCAGLFVALWLGLNAVWWWPYLTASTRAIADVNGVDAFAARAENAGGVFVALLGGGGIWHGPSVPTSHTNVVIGALAAALVLGGLVAAFRHLGKARIPLVLTSVVGLVIPLLGGLPATRGVIQGIVLTIPGGGLLRDGQKFVWLTVAVAVLGLGAFIERADLAAHLRARLALALAVIPIALLPQFAWGMGDSLTTAHYPSSLLKAADIVNAHDAKAASFPWSLYRQYAWNDERVTLDPWGRLIEQGAVVNDSLPLKDGRTVTGENADSARVDAALRAGSSDALEKALRTSGVRYLVVSTDQPDAARVPWVGSTVFEADGVRLQDLGPTGAPRVPASRYVGLLIAAASLIVMLGLLARRAPRQPGVTQK